jgi:hypothetical protein
MGVVNDGDIAIKAGLDEIFFQEYDYESQPDQVLASDPLFFRQDSTEWGAIQNAEFSGPGDFSEVEDDEEVPEGNVRIGNKQTLDVKNYEQDVPFPQAFLEDSEKYAIKQGAVAEMGVSAVTTRDKFAYRRSWGNPFDATNNPTPDGAAMCSNSHTTLSGDTVDNLETGTLSADNLKVIVRRLRLQKRQNGALGSYHFDALLVALNLFETAVELTDSELKPGTVNNNLNWVSNIYPGVRVGTNEYLHSDYNTITSNVDTSYFAICRRHKVTRSVRKGIETEWVDPMYDRKRRGFYRARFRERVYPGTWSGFVGSNGTV